MFVIRKSDLATRLHIRYHAGGGDTTPTLPLLPPHLQSLREVLRWKGDHVKYCFSNCIMYLYIYFFFKQNSHGKVLSRYCVCLSVNLSRNVELHNF